MTLYYNEATDGLAIAPDFCPVCDFGEGDFENARNDTGCGAPGCNAARYDCCGRGCDAGYPDSRCDQASEEESDEDRDARHDRERAFWGLPALDDQEGNHSR